MPSDYEEIEEENIRTWYYDLQGWIFYLVYICGTVIWRKQNMVRIRLRRQGLKGQPTYRIVVTDQRKPRNGGYLESIGHYNPRTCPATEVINEARALYWLSVGAQPSDAVRRLLEHTGTWCRFQRLRAGENIEELVREAEENQSELPSPRTNYPSPGDGEGRIEPPESHETPEPLETPETSELPESPESPTEDPASVNTDEPRPEPEGSTEENNSASSGGSREDNELDSSEPDNSPSLLEDEDETDGVDFPADLYKAFNRPGKTQLSDPDPLAPGQLQNPDRRSKRTKEELEKAIRNEPDKEARSRLTMSREWESKDPATREFLKQEYAGRCQICGFTFPKEDGDPYFERTYIVSYTEARWLDNPANVLCLCANHTAMFQHGASKAKDILDQIKSYKKGDPYHDVNVQLCGESKTIRFTQRHIIDLNEFIASPKNRPK